MSIKLIANVKNPPIGALAAVYLINSSTPVEIVWSNETALLYPNGNRFVCHSNVEVLRALARAAPAYTPNLYGETAIERTQIDHWLSFALTFEDDMSLLDKSIAPVTFLVGNKLTIADLALFSEIHTNYMKLTAKGIPQNVQRWYDLLAFQPSIQKALNSLPAESFTETKSGSPAECEETPKASGERKREGKFVVLPGAEMGKVVVRFPPEASGYLHIGHAKAALLNQYYALAFDGKLIMRFDDTNPAKETVEFENVILGDLELLQIKPDLFTHTSNYFDIMLDYCEQLIKSGKAYVDDTPPEQMKLEREQKIESVNRLNDAEKNMSMWQEMKKGTEMGQKYCVRAKIDMSSANGCMRDPTIYRCKNEPHPRTGTKYKVYPTYDFACPIVDAIENVTHTLRTMEYHDRDDQFYWFIDALNLRKPYIWEYSRLNMTNTVLSKRKLAWFVEQGLVDGWDDPRFPTVRGILRRGMTVEGLKEFIIAQGSSKSVVFMNWDKIWAFNKKVIDPIAPRYTALRYDNRVLVNVSGAATETIEVPVHPKNASLGKKTVKLGPRIYIDYTDAETLREGENTTFINWGNLLIQKINKDTSSGKIISMDASLNLDNKDFKKTLKLTWLAVEDDPLEYPPTYCVYFDHIISKPVLGKDEDFKQYIGHKTREELKMLGDPELKKCKKGDIIQLQRQGFFKVDNAYAPASGFSNAVSPVILFHIPDGHTKDMPSGALKMNSNTLNNAENNSVHRSTTTTSTNVEDLDKEIIKQGKFVRDLKERKSPKQEIDIAVKQLLSLKADYKSVTGCEWKPQSQPQQSIKTPVGSNNNKIVETVNIENGLKKPDHLDDGQPNDGKINEILTRISSQGDKVRELKSNKAEKELIDVEVKALLKLKADYKKLTGADWKPGLTPKVQIKQENSPEPPSASTIGKLLEKISSQGNKIRQLKAAKVDKSNIDAEVRLLLALKADFKSLTGQEWKPDINPSTIIKSISPEPIKIDLTVDSDTTSESEKAKLWRKIKTQGDYVRKLKSEKQPKVIIEAEVQSLLFLKSEYKNIFGQEWNPQEKIEPSTAVRDEESEGYTPISEKDQLIKEIYERDEKIQIDKSNNASEEQVQDDMKRLLALKARYKQVTGMDFPVKARTASACSKASLDVEKKQLHKTEKSTKKEKSPKVAPKKECATAAGGGGALKKQTRLGLEATKENNLPEWYSQIITKAELIEYYDVSGCYILRPWSFAVWKAIKNWFDAKITEMGVKECYFPIFVSRSALEREKDHVADFAPEVAWVTKSGESDLAEPIAVRPTSETVMYPAYAKWIQSYRDLPLRLNQWSNVVRWEFKHPQPFLRTREFLWQEGHTAFASQSDADKEVLDILDLYAKIYTDLLAIPVVKGRKTEKEKFAGASYTTTVEAFVSASGRAIQGATSHHLGQNFSKMFEIVYEDPETQQKQYVFQNSWGITTRTIGVMVMVHADNQGIILPPHVACIQAIIVPCGITVNTNDVEREELLNACKKLEDKLRSYGVRCEGDYRDNYSPGWKFNHWELKGVPLRIELGPKDIKANQIVAVRRDTGEKLALTLDNVESNITDLLENVHESLFAKASADLKSHTKIVKDWSEFCKVLDQKNILLSPFCGEISCEDKIKADSARDEDAEPGAPSMGAKSLCIPFDQPAAITTTDKCIHPGCSLKPKYYTLFGRSY